MKHLLVVAVTAAALCVSAHEAPAQSAATIDKAKKYFESGKQAYAAGQYRVAAAAFEEAFRLVPRPAILFSAAQAYRRQYFVDRKPRDLRRAVELFKLYVDKVADGGRRQHAVEHLSNLEPLWLRIEASQPKNPPRAAPQSAPTQLLVSSSTKGARAIINGKKPSKIPVTYDVKPGKHTVRVEAPGYFPQQVQELAVKGRLIVVRVELRPKPAVFNVKAPSGAIIAINGRTYGTAPLPRPIQIAAGSHYVTVTQRGHKPFSRDLDLARGQVADIDVHLAKTRQRKIAYWIGGGAAVLLGGGVLTTLLALNQQKKAKDIRDSFTSNMTNISAEQLDEYNTALDNRNRWKSASYGLFGVGAALAGTAALMWLVDNPRPKAPEQRNKPSVTPTLGPGVLGANVTGSF